MYKIGINKERNKVNLKKKVSIRQRQQRKAVQTWLTENWSTLSNTNQEQREKTIPERKGKSL